MEHCPNLTLHCLISWAATLFEGERAEHHLCVVCSMARQLCRDRRRGRSPTGWTRLLTRLLP